MNINDILTIENQYSTDKWAGNRRTALEFASTFSRIPTFAQFGVANGESARWLIPLCDELHLYDSFEGLPRDWNEKFKQGHFKCEIPKFTESHVSIHVGWFNDTILKFNDKKFGLIHLDADLYESTKVILDNITTFPGQVLVFDEFYNIPQAEENEQKAFIEWISNNNIQYELLGKTSYSQVIVRIK